MKADKVIRVVPMASWLGSPVHQNHLGFVTISISKNINLNRSVIRCLSTITNVTTARKMYCQLTLHKLKAVRKRNLENNAFVIRGFGGGQDNFWQRHVNRDTSDHGPSQGGTGQHHMTPVRLLLPNCQHLSCPGRCAGQEPL